MSTNKKSQEKVSKPTIALVNEDKASSFNKKDYNREIERLKEGILKLNKEYEQALLEVESQ